MLKGSFLVFLVVLSLKGEDLTLQMCIDQALAHHPDLKALNYAVEQSAYATDALRSEYLPQIQTVLEYDPLKTFVIPYNGALSTKQESATEASVLMTQRIYDFGQTDHRINSAKRSEKIAKLSLEEMKGLMIYRVQLIYEALILQQMAISVQKEDIYTKSQLYTQAQAKVITGLKTKVDELRFYAAMENAKESYARAEADYQKSIVALEHLIGASIPKNVTLENQLENVKTVSYEKFAALKIRLEGDNLDLRRSDEAIVLSTLKHDAAQSEHYPKIDALASYAHVNSFSSYDNLLIGARATLPLYSGGKLSAEAQKARSATLEAKQMRASRILVHSEEFDHLMIDIERADKTIAAKESVVLSASSSKELTEARYQEGLATYLEVLDVTALLLEAKLDRLRALYEKSTAIHRVELLLNTNSKSSL